MADIEVMTGKERERAERNKAIIKEFKKLNPELMAKGYKPYRTLCVLAERHNMTPAGVRYILTSTGIINSLKEVTEQAETGTETENA